MAKSYEPCYTKTTKGGGKYTTCEGAQKKRKARAKLKKGGTAPVMVKKKAKSKPPPKKKPPPKDDNPQGFGNKFIFSRNMAGRVNTGTLNPANPNLSVNPWGTTPEPQAQQNEIDSSLFLKVSAVMTQVGKENLKQGFDIPFPSKNVIGFREDDRDEQYKLIYKVAPMVILREKPLTLTEFKKFLTQGDRVSKEESQLIKEYYERMGETYEWIHGIHDKKKLSAHRRPKEAKPYLAIRGKIVGNRVRPHYYTKALYQGDDGVGNKSVELVDKRSLDDIKIIFTTQPAIDEIVEKTDTEGNGKQFAPNNTIAKGYTRSSQEYLKHFSQPKTSREIGKEIGIKSYGMSVAVAKSYFLKPGDIGFSLPNL